jgi:hypothetical protein
MKYDPEERFQSGWTDTTEPSSRTNTRRYADVGITRIGLQLFAIGGCAVNMLLNPSSGVNLGHASGAWEYISQNNILLRGR